MMIGLHACLAHTLHAGKAVIAGVNEVCLPLALFSALLLRLHGEHMRYFRRLKSPILVALIAVAMQATLLLAHAHVHPHASVGQQWGQSASLACRAMVPPEGCRPAIPKHEHHDDCPLCWSLTASGAGLLPSPIIVAAAELPRPSPRPQSSSPMLSEAGRSPFEARAPPHA